MLSIYNYFDYKKYLKAFIAASEVSRGLMKQWAKSANCHPSYITQVLKSHVQLTQDQAVALAESLNLSEAERDFFLLLVDHARSGTPALRKIIERKLSEIKSKQEKISERLKREGTQDEVSLAQYYSSWLYSFIHILVSIPGYQTIDNISEKLNLKKEITLKILATLEKMNLVEHQQNLWKHSGKQLHVSEESNLVHAHHNNWRQQAVLNSQMKSSESVHFTGLYSISNSDYVEIKNTMLKMLETINAKALGSGTEELIVICCDLFQKDR